MGPLNPRVSQPAHEPNPLGVPVPGPNAQYLLTIQSCMSTLHALALHAEVFGVPEVPGVEVLGVPEVPGVEVFEVPEVPGVEVFEVPVTPSAVVS